MYARLYACIPELALLPLQPDDGSLHDLLSQGNASSLDPDIPPPPSLIFGCCPRSTHQACKPELALSPLQPDDGSLCDLLSQGVASSLDPNILPPPPPLLIQQGYPCIPGLALLLLHTDEGSLPDVLFNGDASSSLDPSPPLEHLWNLAGAGGMICCPNMIALHPPPLSFPRQ